MFTARKLTGLIAAALMTAAGAATAGDLLYRPLIPAFGGNPDNFGYLLNTAQIQNTHLPPSNGGGGGGAPDINFPPIVIDLGGIGGGVTPPVTPAAPAAASATPLPGTTISN
ncbi:curli assembly protein CsgF [Roseovarius nanhaiticus]|uniref:Curli production assembly/transport component CsgF n=1 Tax=Roseovarius nanhaiticus TaxID=573024 RepID=A0A1N7FUL3_9RHOB|nr:curli assembly protein CsgF [Roseovarius nanhaiticus]SEK45084.1 Type VIII secretion system (T8SS), CsgF protein [Roseovarius nanhaiticus]SIS03984.1 Type VIII secretion system (T8SS), CsgF protein [Roseovarius nanhaiticus]